MTRSSKVLNIDGTIDVIPFTALQEQEADAYEAAFNIEEAKAKYKKDRNKGYGSIEEQLDMLYWDQVNSTTNWVNHIKAVKDKHPKPKATVVE